MKLSQVRGNMMPLTETKKIGRDSGSVQLSIIAGAKQEVSLQLTLRYIYLPHVWLLNNYSDDALGTVEHIF